MSPVFRRENEYTESSTSASVMNQFANNNMLGDVAMGVRKLSYEAFKSKAREHQVKFREAELQVGFYKYPNVLRYEDARHGLAFYEGFREEIMNELQKPVPNTSGSKRADARERQNNQRKR